MKKYNTVIIDAYNHLNEEPEVPPVPAPTVDPGAEPPVEPTVEVPPEEEPILEPPVDLETIDKLRQALLVNRDEIDFDEYSIVQQEVTPDNVDIIAGVIDSILGKSFENTGEVQPIGPS